MQNKTFFTFDQAIKALESKNNALLADILFQFRIDDAYYIEQVANAIRSLLSRPDITPAQEKSIQRTLHGLSRLPLCTPGLDIQILLSVSNESGAESYDFYFDENHFHTDSGGYVDFGQGSDSLSGSSFMVEKKHRNEEVWHNGFLPWPEAFANLASSAELEIVDLSDDGLIDWKYPDGSRFWEWIADHE